MLVVEKYFEVISQNVGLVEKYFEIISPLNYKFKKIRDIENLNYTAQNMSYYRYKSKWFGSARHKDIGSLYMLTGV